MAPLLIALKYLIVSANLVAFGYQLLQFANTHDSYHLILAAINGFVLVVLLPQQVPHDHED